MGFGHFLKGVVDGAGKKLDDAAEGLGEAASDVSNTLKPGGSLDQGIKDTVTNDWVRPGGRVDQFTNQVAGNAVGALGRGVSGLGHVATDSPTEQRQRRDELWARNDPLASALRHGDNYAQGLSGDVTTVERGARRTPGALSRIPSSLASLGESRQDRLDATHQRQQDYAAGNSRMGNFLVNKADTAHALGEKVADVPQAAENVGRAAVWAAQAATYDDEKRRQAQHYTSEAADLAWQHKGEIAATAGHVAYEVAKDQLEPKNLLMTAATAGLTTGAGTVATKIKTARNAARTVETVEAAEGAVAAADAVEATSAAAHQFSNTDRALGALPRASDPYLHPVSTVLNKGRTALAQTIQDTGRGSRVSEFLANTVEGIGRRAPVQRPGQSMESYESAMNTWRGAAAARRKTQADVVQSVVHAVAHPEQAALEVGTSLVQDHKDEIVNFAQDHARDQIVGQIRGEAQDRLTGQINDQLPGNTFDLNNPNLPNNLDDVTGKVEDAAKDLKDKGQSKLDEEKAKKEEPQRPNTNVYQTLPGGQAVAPQPTPWAAPTEHPWGDPVDGEAVSPNGVPTPAGMEQTVKSDTTASSEAMVTGRAAPLGRRNGAFQQGHKRPGMHAWQGPNREAFGGIGVDHDWRPFVQRPIQQGGGSVGQRTTAGASEGGVTESKGMMMTKKQEQVTAEPQQTDFNKLIPMSIKPVSQEPQDDTAWQRPAGDVAWQKPLVQPGVRMEPVGGESENDSSRVGNFDTAQHADYTQGVVQGVEGGATSNMYNPMKLPGTYLTSTDSEVDPLTPAQGTNAAEAAPARKPFTNRHGRGPGH
jgi:hypothetical protein